MKKGASISQSLGIQRRRQDRVYVCAPTQELPPPRRYIGLSHGEREEFKRGWPRSCGGGGGGNSGGGGSGYRPVLSEIIVLLNRSQHQKRTFHSLTQTGSPPTTYLYLVRSLALPLSLFPPLSLLPLACSSSSSLLLSAFSLSFTFYSFLLMFMCSSPLIFD